MLGNPVSCAKPNLRGFLEQMQKLIKLILITLIVVLVSGCSGLRFPGVFRIDIGQGNIITQAMVDRLQVGMTPRQVEFVMGSAMIRDPFHPDRWDYLYYYETGSGVQVDNRVTLHFDNNRLSEIDLSQFKDPEGIQKHLNKR